VRANEHLDSDRADLAASFQEAVIDVLATKAERAMGQTGYETFVLGGGVACNRALVDLLHARLPGTRIAVARPRLNTDNAAMIARAGWYRWQRGEAIDPFLDADASMPWPGLVVAEPPDQQHPPTTTHHHKHHT